MPRRNRPSEAQLIDKLNQVSQLLGTTPDAIARMIDEGTVPTFEERLLNIYQITAWFGVGRTTVYRWIKENKFPEPISFGNPHGPYAMKRWYYHEVRAWLHGRPRGVAVIPKRKSRWQE